MNIYIILVNFNGIKLTEDCIDSIYQSKYDSSKYKVNIVVVDNGSKRDETQDLKRKYKDLIFIRSEENLGFAGGNNLGINRAISKGAEYVLLINNDTVLDKYMLQRLFENAQPNVVLTSKMLYYNKPDTIWCEGGKIDWKKGNSYNGKINQKDAHAVQNYYCEFTSGCCMFIPCDVIRKVGLLNSDYFMYCEDTEYCIRLKKAGIKVMVIPTATLYHKVSMSSGGEDSPFSIYYMTRNRLRFIKEYSELFSSTAMRFAIVSRYIRCIQFFLLGKRNKSLAIIYAVHDFKKNRFERSNYKVLKNNDVTKK